MIHKSRHKTALLQRNMYQIGHHKFSWSKKRRQLERVKKKNIWHHFRPVCCEQHWNRATVTLCLNDIIFLFT